MRRFIRLFWAGLAAIIVIPVVGGFFSELAKELGFYERPIAKIGGVVNWFISLGADPTYRIIAAFVCGVAIGMFLDAVLRRREGQGGTVQTEDSDSPINYAHGLALERVQPSLDPANLQNTLETRLVLRNASGGPIKFSVEKFDVTMEGNIVKTSGITAVIAKDGQLTVIPNRGFSKKQYNGFKSRGIGTAEYSILYGHPDKAPTRRSYKLIGLDLFKKKNAFSLNWLIQNESDEPFSG